MRSSRLTSWMASFAFAASQLLSAPLPLEISELMAGGQHVLADEDDDYPDWIELWNSGGSPVNLSGWQLTDDPKRPSKWRFPATNIAPSSFLVVFASEKNRKVPGDPLHTNFKLSGRGEYLALRDPDGRIATEFSQTYPVQVPGVAYGFSATVRTNAALSAATNVFRVAHYLSPPSPGRANPDGPSRLGPLIEAVNHTPALPALPSDKDDIHVEATIRPLIGRVESVELHFRVMFEPEVVIPMASGVASEEGAGPSKQRPLRESTGTSVVYRAQIPAAAAKPGQLVRYYITANDEAGRASRWPMHPSRRDSTAFLGTVIADPGLTTKLPVAHLFVPQERGAHDFESGYFGLFYNGEYYDNVRFRQHGQISQNFPKTSFNLDFPRDHRFRYGSGDSRVKDIKLMANYADKSKIRNTLAYEFIAATGCLGHFAFPVRVQCNGKFYSVAEFIEDGDDRWLSRVGLDPRGALYKIYNNLTSAHGAEKKTQKHEDNRDLELLVRALDENRPLGQRASWAWDHLDLPQCINYFVAMALISSDDHGHKNYYLYCDSRGSGEWALLPWDVDLSWGRNWTGHYFDEQIFSDNPIDLYRYGRRKPHNRLYNLMFEHPDFRQMYLRRLRSVMDATLQPPGTPQSQLKIERRVRELIDLIDPKDAANSDARLDERRWRSWGNNTSAGAEAQRIIDEYLPGRRKFLFHPAQAKLEGDTIPGSQPDRVPLKLGRVEAKPVSGKPDEQFVAITNGTPIAVDVSGWMLEGGGIRHAFRPGTVIPAGKQLYVSPDVEAFRRRKAAPRGGQSLMVQGNFHGSLGAADSPLVLKDSSSREVDSLDLSTPEKK